MKEKKSGWELHTGEYEIFWVNGKPGLVRIRGKDFIPVSPRDIYPTKVKLSKILKGGD